jgi:hypothetical protein
MAPTRRNSNRRNKSLRIVRRVYSPVSHFLQLTSNAVGVATNTARNLVQRSIKAVNGLGSSVAGHTNATINNLTRARGRRSSRRSASRRASRR